MTPARLTLLAPDLHAAEFTFRRTGGLRLHARMTVVQLPAGGLALISPIPIDDALAAELAALGPTEHLVAPNRYHHLFLGPARARYPNAALHGAPGLAAKRADLRLHHTLGAAADSPLAPALDQLLIEGAPRMSEVVFRHRASASLIVTDVAFNIPRSNGWPSDLAFALMGVRGRVAQSRSWRWFIEDRAAAAASATRLLAWDFQRLVVAHGEVVTDDAPGKLRAALTRMLAAGSRAPSRVPSAP